MQMLREEQGLKTAVFGRPPEVGRPDESVAGEELDTHHGHRRPGHPV
jgi:hypothetical protein